MNCASCRHWKPPEPDPWCSQDRMGLGECQATPMFWDATTWSLGDDPERMLKPELVGTTAFVQDGSDFSATLYTRPEHGCSMHKPPAR